jgi:hypothetical protein
MDKFEALGFKVKLVYWESGMCFCGLYEDGHDDYYDYTDMSADDFEKEINPEIDECMCVIENLREWEEMNAEESNDE